MYIYIYIAGETIESIQKTITYRNIYRALLLRIEHCKTEKSIHRLPIYIYILYIFVI